MKTGKTSSRWCISFSSVLVHSVENRLLATFFDTVAVAIVLAGYLFNAIL